MRILILALLLSNTVLAEDCIQKGTSFIEVMKSPDFKIKYADELISKLAEPIEAMTKYRKQKCDATPEMIFDNCKSSCVLLDNQYKSYIDTCRNYCAIQKLKIKASVELKVCEDKLQALAKIEKDIRKYNNKENAGANR